jgi:6-phosphogluconolactonase
MFTRRRFLLTFPAVAAFPRAFSDAAHAQSLGGRFRRTPAAPPSPTFAYFGTDTDKGASRGIYISRFDEATGHFTDPQLAAATVRPSFLAISQPVGGHRRLYAVNAVPNPSATVTSFSVNPTNGALTEINQVSSDGAGPCYISLNAADDVAFVANYVGSTVATYRILPNGALSNPIERFDYKETRFGHRGPNTARQDVPHPHSVHLSPDNRFLLVSDLGSDEISIFLIEAAEARLGTPSLFSNGRPGSGPRHIAFHPNGRWVYSINELDSTIDRFLWTSTSSRTAPQGLLINTGEVVKTTAPGFPAAKNTAAEVAVSSDGNFLYASNRGEDTLVVYTIADEGGLSFLQRIPSGGRTPRHFTLSPSGRWLVCGNQDSASVTVFRRDGGTGRLSGPVQTISLDYVMFTLFA